MSCRPDFNGLQVTLLALLPKDGQHQKLSDLAKKTAATEGDVIKALMDPYIAGDVGFDVFAGVYTAWRA